MIEEIGKSLGFEYHWYEDLLVFWRGNRNAFTHCADLRHRVWDDKIVLCLFIDRV